MDDLRDFRCRLTAESALMLEAIRARRLRVIEQRMHVAPAWQVPHLVACWIRECGR